ncbi:MAG: BMP family ABC transporter substrate-binding protein [Firmicutes bacterium]|uniref:BMP family ABC transporter substrate-binding protein n=1 Tax=Candidatus Stercoripulliclostridium pullicola TaxID=2840953 RepID=A0A940ICW7_9FIRM|nr:BMP family ABC transporter substrate-binding protein [Candidatus Stercoripulliclostridium pullicola]
MKRTKVLALILAVAVLATAVFALTACKDDETKGEITLPAYEAIETPDYSSVTVPADFKIGFIFLHDANSTYDKNFIDAAEEAVAAMGLTDAQVEYRTNIDESEECYNTARELVDAGCDVIFADSFGHETYMLKAAREFPNVEFCHATGTMAHTAGLANFHNAFASIYEGRYLAGIAAGMKLKELYGDENGNVSAENAKIGYVGAFTYAEVISGYTSFYLGAKSVVSNVTMEVTFTGSWYDEAAEREGANNLISRGAKLISQHADSMGAPSACEVAGIPNVSYNGSTYSACPNTFIVSSRINWVPYFKYIIAQKAKGEAIAADYTGSIKDGSVVLTNLGSAAAAGTVEAIVAARTQLANGTLNVFDTSKFTVGGETKTSYKADVDTDDKYTPDTEVIENGIFRESKFRSAPYFDLRIDGITLLDEKF